MRPLSPTTLPSTPIQWATMDFCCKCHFQLDTDTSLTMGQMSIEFTALCANKLVIWIRMGASDFRHIPSLPRDLCWKPGQRLVYVTPMAYNWIHRIFYTFVFPENLVVYIRCNKNKSSYFIYLLQEFWLDLDHFFVVFKNTYQMSICHPLRNLQLYYHEWLYQGYSKIYSHSILGWY